MSAPTKLEKSFNLEANNVAKNISLVDRIEPTCHLINPSKNKLGKISK